MEKESIKPIVPEKDMDDNTENGVEYPGLYWSKEDAIQAAFRHTFIRVTRHGKRSMRQISGAERIWNRPESEDELYLVNYRVSGKPSDIAIALNRAGYTEEQVRDALDLAISKDTYKGKSKELYEQELEKLKEFKKEEKVRNNQDRVSWDTLMNIASNAKKTHVILKEKPNTLRGVAKRKTLMEQFDRVQGLEGKVVDVSMMRDDGTGITVKNKPNSERSRSVFLETIPIISNNEERFLRALEMLYKADQFESEEEYQKIVNKMRAKFNKKRKR